MKQVLPNAVFLYCLLACGAASASPTIDGSTLFAWLQSSDERDGAIATGYIGGVREVTYRKEHCAGNHVQVMVAVSAVKRTLAGMSQYRHLPASWIVIEALRSRWPCAAAQKPAATAPAPPRQAPAQRDRRNK